MFEIKVEAQFKVDYKRTMRMHPQLKSEFKAAVAELVAHGLLPAEYGAHELSNPGGFPPIRWLGRCGRSLSSP